MPLERTFFIAYLDDPEAPEGHAEHRVEIRSADRLLAEQTVATVVDGEARPQATAHAWAWAALKREGRFAGRFNEFVKVCIDVVKDKDADEATVDPTQPAVSPDSA